MAIGDIEAKQDGEITVPLMLNNSPGVGCCGVKLSYDPEVVLATNATQGDFTNYFGFDDSNAGNGWLTINTYIMGTDLVGDLLVADVTLKAVGNIGNSSLLGLEVLTVADQYGYDVPTDTDNGTFTIRSKYMSKIHVLESNNNKTYQTVIHFDTPAGNNSVGLTWKAVGLASGMIGSTVLEVGTNPSNTTQAEYDDIIAGDVIEIVRGISVEGSITNAAIEALVDILINEWKANMSSILKYFGKTID